MPRRQAGQRGNVVAGWHIGVIGGSGLYEPGELAEAQEMAVDSPFGESSGPLHCGTLEGIRFTFLARHGVGHRLPPSAVNYRANIDALKRSGVTDILAISAIGSLREQIAPGEFVAVDQIIDRTLSLRERSFFGPGIVAHVPMADPVCPRLSRLAADAVATTGAAVHRTGCYIAIEGPQFSTRAESRMYRAWGGDVIGMTAMPEARLAREAELPYALLGMVTDYDCWREGGDVEVSEIIRVMQANAAVARSALGALARALPASRDPSPIDSVLDAAVLTPRERWEPGHRSKLDAVARRLMPPDP